MEVSCNQKRKEVVIYVRLGTLTKRGLFYIIYVEFNKEVGRKTMKEFATLIIVLTLAFGFAVTADGMVTFGPKQVISDNTSAAQRVNTADVDGDGDIDVLGASILGEKWAWYENDGTPGGLGDWVFHGIPSILSFPSAIVPADIDKDGDMDLFGSSNHSAGPTARWFQNNGSGTFTEWTISNPNIPVINISGGRQIIAADINGDGNMDAVSANRASNQITPGGDLLSWHENDGTPVGHFEFVNHLIDPTVEPGSIAAADINGDGFMDVIAGVLVFSPVSSERIVWYENTGTGASWIRHDIYIGVGDFNVCVNSEDIDNDGDYDVVYGDLINDRFVWHENLDGNGNFGPPQIIALDIDPYDNTLVDIDDDGDLDLVGTAFSGSSIQVGWYENDGTPGGLGDWTAHAIDVTVGSGGGIHTEDIDGDGDLDVVASVLADGSEIVWYEQLGVPIRGTISGFVNDFNNIPIPDARVLFLKNGVKTEVKTDVNGWYIFTGLIDDTYNIVARKLGMKDTRKAIIKRSKKWGLNEYINLVLE